MVKKVSLKDIAQKIGVSTALVSYVLSGNEEKGRVGKETANKIRLAAKELNYQPNHIAKSLKTGKTNTIGLIVADISNPFFASIARAVEDESSKFGLTTIMGSSDESPEKLIKLVDVFLKRQVDGFIISPPELSEETISYIQALGIPLCLIDRHFENLSTNYVITDNYNSMHEAVSKYPKTFDKKIALITYKSKLQHMIDRKNGFLESSVKNEKIVYEIDYSLQQEDLKYAIEEILNRGDVELVVFTTNTLSVAGLKILTQRAIQIPNDINVLCFDSSEVYEFFYHPITHVKQPIEQLALNGVRILVDQIQNSTSNQQVVLKSQIIN